MHFNVGDIIFQVVLLISLVVPIVLIVLFITCLTKQRQQTNRIEEKLDQLLKDKNSTK
ncbi:DUF4083 domain-containing protein [Peribacillus asahii]|uniref:DUF4083 domain-containing protein n=1 Tax=Peribacillus asahii TaxID=228899 RepID=UPI00207B0D74|nr:DUF4083 domain-containing protein [Peribacillus asahii]USK70972.1 DUF4083 domain-containing protein [Peribacillus asahii]